MSSARKSAARAAQLRVELSEHGFPVALIARNIAEECGFRPRAAFRYAVGMSGQQAADIYNARYGTSTQAAPMTKSRISEYENWPLPGAARKPSAKVLAGLASLYETTVDQLLDRHDIRALGPDETLRVLQTAAVASTGPDCLAMSPQAGVPTIGVDTTNRRNALRLMGAGVIGATAPSPADAMAHTRNLERSEIGPSAIEQLEVQLHRLHTTYAAQPPAATWPAAQERRDEAAGLLEARLTLKQRREVTYIAGMYSVVCAWLAHDMGDVATAEAFCVDAYAHGEHAEQPLVRAWADDARATIALYDDRPTDALKAAQRGFAAAPQDSPAAARLAAQVSRAHAKLGHTDAFNDAHAIARRYADQLPAHGAGLFGADAVRLSSYDASSYLWLGQPTEALRAALNAIAQYREVPFGRQSPTRMAIAQIDLGSAHAALGEIDGAIANGREALSTERLVGSISKRATDLSLTLLRTHPTSQQVRSFAVDVRAARPAAITG